ncbi:ribosome small subunit-dependent GTPase A [Helcococcus sueciensis]|uniref:ribosome small subunit-dependent GTPase A n=1 Tax=Helcococcus sueciensis TaxID=241555 RepID=UPI0004214A07|nr:ribosome small subunit-dependent GTPase A [Helcococcus sueciensis]
MKIDYGINKYFEKRKLDTSVKNIYRIINRTINYFDLANEFTDYLKINIDSKNEDYIIGDFVEITKFNDEHFILRNFERISLITKASNTTKKNYLFNENEQNLAANVNQLFILVAADQRFTLSKFERYLLTFSSMVDETKVIISKSDIKEKADKIVSEIKNVYPNIKIYSSSIYDENSMNDIIKLFNQEETAIFVGSSGAGKSTLINYLLDNKTIETQDVRSDGKGKHTTTSSNIYYSTKTNSYIIDTPGFKGISTNREINDDVLFNHINELSSNCKFNDCKHETEPGCAIHQAIKNGELSQELYERYLRNKEREFKINKFLDKKNKKNEIKKNSKRR